MKNADRNFKLVRISRSVGNALLNHITRLNEKTKPLQVNAGHWLDQAVLEKIQREAKR